MKEKSVVDNNVNNKESVEVILIVPLGVEEIIFPWGVHSLADYLENTCDLASLSIWDFREDNYFAELYNRYGDLINKLFFSLGSEEMEMFLGLTINPYVFLGIAACTGAGFFKAAGRARWFRRSYARELRSLKDEFEAHIARKIGEYSSEKNRGRRIWGLSVYDRTFFNSLCIARLIRRNDPGASIILGGDYFDFQSAKKTIQGISFVDGIVVGYGEEVMRTIVEALRQGRSIRDLRLQGLVNDGFIASPGENTAIEAVNVPPVYKNFSGELPISYVKKRERDEIRILTQRGCSWGKCSFCTQIDKEMFFPLPVEHIIKETRDKIPGAGPGVGDSAIRISFDSDENGIDMFAAFVKYLDGMDDSKTRFDIKLWLQVKSFRREFAEVLTSIDGKRMKILFVLNFESLNDSTLGTMRKGHSPLKAIEAAKAILDCGFHFQTNYFIHYPLENSSSIERETEMLKRSAHLVMPPKVRLILFPYYANRRDEISRNQDKYNVNIRRPKSDSWIKHTFGIDLPFSFFLYSYDQRLAFNLERLLAYTYHQTIKARDAINRPARVVNIKWEKGKTQLQDRAEFFSRYAKSHAISRSLKHWLWKSIHCFVQLLAPGKGRAYRQRMKFYAYLSEIMDSAGETQTGKKTGKHALTSHFFLEGGYLKKEYNGPGRKEKWSLPLDGKELEMLRFLYWIRKRGQVIETFKDAMSETEINKIIDRHIDLGSIVPFKNSLLCVVNDPGYWQKTKKDEGGRHVE
jgi:hypothetical protein